MPLRRPERGVSWGSIFAAVPIGVVISDEADLAVLSLASGLAARTGVRLAVLVVQSASTSTMVQCKSAPDDDGAHPLLSTAWRRIDALVNRDVALYDCRGPKTSRAVLSAAAELECQALVLAAQLGGPEDDSKGLRRKLGRVAPMDVFFFDVGPLEDSEPTRVLVPQIGGGGSHALSWSFRGVAPRDSEVVAIADPESSARSGRVFSRESRRPHGFDRTRLRQIEPRGGSLTDAIGAELTNGDLVLIDADHPRRLLGQLASFQKMRDARPDASFGLGVSRASNAVGPGIIGREIERLRTFAPVLSRGDRVGLHERIEAGGRLSTDFVVMLTVSAAIASLGLVQGSAAVVIGAMLVAPLMTPLVAAGMGIVQGNLLLFRNALRAMSVGVFGALVVSTVIGLLSPWQDLSAEVTARTGPNLFDFAIALLSGIAAAYALARPGLAGTLVGVAIAVALVPPLGAVGICFAQGEFLMAGGAAILFATNFLAIILGAAAVFRFFGLHVARIGDTTPNWVRAASAALLIGVLATSAPLLHNQFSQSREGVNRPFATPLPDDLRAAIEARVEEEPGIDIFLMAHSGIEHGFGVQIALVGDAEISESLVADLRGLVSESLGDSQPIRILTLSGMERFEGSAAYFGPPAD